MPYSTGGTTVVIYSHAIYKAETKLTTHPYGFEESVDTEKMCDKSCFVTNDDQ